MRRSMLAAAAVAVGLTFAASVAVPASADVQKPRQVTLFSGPTGGAWYPIAGGLSKVFADAGVRSAAEVGGGVSNVAVVSQGRGEIGFTMSIVPRMAELGLEPFEAPITNVMGIARLSPNKVHVVVSKDSGVTSIKELKGKPFASQPVGNVTTEAFKAVLAANGMKEDDIELTRGGQGYGASQMKDRRVVGFTGTTNVPSPAFADVAQSLDVRFLPLDDETFAAMQKDNPGFVRSVLPAGSYRGQDEDVPTAATDLILITHDRLSDDEAYWITKTLVENLDQVRRIHASLADLTVEGMAQVPGLKLHPGAERYYREAGAL